MRRLSVAIPVIVIGVCLYFIAVFGRESLHIFSSPVWGLDHESFSRAVYDIARVFGFGPTGIVMLAAFLGALKLAVATVFALHIADRIRGLGGSAIDHELFDAAIVLAVVSTFIAALPALLEATPQYLAQHRPALWLAGLAATLSVIERVAGAENDGRLNAQFAHASAAAAPLPRRGKTSALRWDRLRREADRR